MATNGNGKRLDITRALTIMGSIMLFLVLCYCVFQIATGGKNEEHLGKIATSCVMYIFWMVLVFHGEKVVNALTTLIRTIKGNSTQGGST
jgi:uncharacterized membrane protein YcfT